MSGQTWAYLAGDTSRFAISFGLESNPHDPDVAAPDTAASWGSFQVWVSGLNLCAHREQGEIIESVHWYLLPLLEWFVTNWNPLLHEERLPVPDFPTASAQAHAPRVVMAQLSERPALDWWSWWTRHNLQAGREGGLFPDLFVRRWRDVVEFSWDSQGLAGAPDDYVFLAARGEYRIDVEAVAVPLHDALGQALNQLAARLPRSPAIAELQRRHRANATGTAEATHRERFAWLSGFEGISGRFTRLWTIVSQRLEGTSDNLRRALLATANRQPLYLPGTPHAAVLFGSASPNVTDHDILQISRILIDTYSPQANSRSQPLEELRSAMADLPSDGRPWEQGYALATTALDVLEIDTSRAVDIRTIAGHQLGITIDSLTLSDTGIRALSVAGPEHVPTMFLNDQYVDGTSEPVQRFSIAHELCHLLVDPDRARNIAVTSGPWAPLDIERRANAFAAALLLPEGDVERFVASFDNVADIQSIQAIATRYQVSMLAVIDHLLNLGFLDRFNRDHLRSEVLARYA
jgi:Zn-dependent peptidase ImmA (M78 family)